MRNPFKRTKKKENQNQPTDINKIAVKTDSRRFVETMLEKPKSQLAEILFELMANYKTGDTRRSLMISCHSLNAPNAIMSLRKKGLGIITDNVEHTNKYGRKIKYGRYYLVDFKEAVKIYNQINQK